MSKNYQGVRLFFPFLSSSHLYWWSFKVSLCLQNSLISFFLSQIMVIAVDNLKTQA